MIAVIKNLIEQSFTNLKNLKDEKKRHFDSGNNVSYNFVSGMLIELESKIIDLNYLLISAYKNE